MKMNGLPVFRRELHRVRDLCAVHFSRRAAEHGEVLAGQMHGAAIDLRTTGDYSIRRNFLIRHAEIGGAVLGKKSDFLKAALIDQTLDTFAGRELAGGMLLVDSFFAAASLDLGRVFGAGFRSGLRLCLSHLCPV